MSGSTKPVIELNIPLEVVETKQESSTVVQEMPTITTLLNRKKLEKTPPPQSSNTPENTNTTAAVTPELPQPPAQQPTKTVVRKPPPVRRPQRTDGTLGGATSSLTSTNPNTPPPFRSVLLFEKLDLKAFAKSLKKNKKSLNNRKLDCLGYFANFFTEMTYFSLDGENFKGILGFGNPTLVSEIRNQNLSASAIPSIADLAKQNEIFAGSIENLKSEDKTGLSNIGFAQTQNVGVFPVYYKKKLQGIWLCTNSKPIELDAKTKKSLKKILGDLNLS